MKIALAHDYLNQFGGAERVLKVFCEIFPDAPIFTLFYDKEKTFGEFDRKVVKTSFLNNKFVINNHRPFIPLMPIAAFFLNLGDEYDVVLSSSAGYGKGFGGAHEAFHICYCHTPLRYAWEYEDYFKWPYFFKMITSLIFASLRRWDKFTSGNPNIILANSNYISGKIKEYYNRDSCILYPPVDLKVFYKDIKIKKADYFLAVGRLVSHKRFDLVIEAFNKLNLPLLIVGSGPELNRLKKIANSPKIFFKGIVSDDCLRNFYNETQAVIFPQVEDFGLVAAEAQACGTPVLAFNAGGVQEIVKNEETGILFDHQTVESLISAIKKFQLSDFNSKKIVKNAQKFDKENFKNKIFSLVNNQINN